MKTNRRSFLRISSAAGAGALTLGANSIELVAQASRALGNRSAEDVASDEGYWRDIQNAFMLDRTLINLNNGNSCPSPTVVHDAYKRYLDYSNQAPVYHRGLIEQKQQHGPSPVGRRVRLRPRGARDHAELQRSAPDRAKRSRLEPGRRGGHDRAGLRPDADHVGSAGASREDQDHEDQFSCADDAGRPVSAVRRAITPQTKVLHFCHITNLTGQLFPVQAALADGSPRGILTIVDGAHAFAHFPFKLRDLEMRLLRHEPAQMAAGAAQHRVPLRAPRAHRQTWPLPAAPSAATNDIRKFEEIGTIAVAPYAAINEALAFHQAIGGDRRRHDFGISRCAG